MSFLSSINTHSQVWGYIYYLLVTLPLWNPVYVQLGDVGYLSKPGGTFVTLFNAFKPHKTSGGLTGGLPSLAGYGKVSKGVHRQDKRNVAQKGLDAVSGFLTFTSRSNDVPISFVVFFSLLVSFYFYQMC